MFFALNTIHLPAAKAAQKIALTSRTNGRKYSTSGNERFQ
jgi:hypothetical protein